MLSRVWSSAVLGVDALPIEIETHTEPNIPRWTVVGLPDGAVRESRDRVWAALKTSNLPVPRGAVTVNLAPADVRKEGSAYDLPIALGLIAATRRGPCCPSRSSTSWRSWASCRSTARCAPSAASSRWRPVRAPEGRRGIVVPAQNAAEAAVVAGLEVYGVASLAEAFRAALRAGRHRHAHAADAAADGRRRARARLRGRARPRTRQARPRGGGGGAATTRSWWARRARARRCSARRLPSILPPLTSREALETTKIHSVGGRLNGSARHGLVAERPFRSPHHTRSRTPASAAAARTRCPGEISLAHNGVLFLDELPEFDRPVLEVLRQPLEEGRGDDRAGFVRRSATRRASC